MSSDFVVQFALKKLHRPYQASQHEQQIGDDHTGKLHAVAGQARYRRAEIPREYNRHRDDE